MKRALWLKRSIAACTDQRYIKPGLRRSVDRNAYRNHNRPDHLRNRRSVSLCRATRFASGRKARHRRRSGADARRWCGVWLVARMVRIFSSS